MNEIFAGKNWKQFNDNILVLEFLLKHYMCCS